MDRQIKWGIGCTVFGLVFLILLADSGAFVEPFSNDNPARRPRDGTAIVGAALLVVAGLAILWQSYSRGIEN